MSAGMTAADLRSLVGDIRGKLGSDPAVVALIAEGEGGSVPYAIAANPAAQDLGIRANDLVKQLAGAVDGRGGGKADLAQGSGKDPSGIDAALAALRDRDSAGQLSGLCTPHAGSARRGRSRTRTAARHRRGQCAHRGGLQRPGRHPGHAGGDGSSRPVRQACATAGRAGRRAAGGRGCRRVCREPWPIAPARRPATRSSWPTCWPAGSRRSRCGWPTSG